MGGRGNAGSRNSGAVEVAGVTGAIAQRYSQSEFAKHVTNIEVRPIEPSELIPLSATWDGTPDDLHTASIKVLNSYVEKNSLNPVKVIVVRKEVAMEMSNGDRVYMTLAEPSGFATKNMSSYLRLYEKVGGKRRQIKKSDW